MIRKAQVVLSLVLFGASGSFWVFFVYGRGGGYVLLSLGKTIYLVVVVLFSDNKSLRKTDVYS